MPRPGVDIQIVDDAPRGGAILDTGQAFMVGVTERGPTEATRVLSARDYATRYGVRSGGSLLSDSVGAYFSEGGSTLYVSRITSDDAVAASAAFGTLTANASSSGVWGNDLEVTADAAPSGPAGAITVAVSLDGTVVERSPVVGTADELVAWSARSVYVDFVRGVDNALPAADVTAALAGGTNGTGVVDHDSVAAALARFDSAFGPGQVLAPGLTADGVHAALCEHADDKTRCALLDLPDSADPTVLESSVAAIQDGTQPGARFAAAFAPWALYPSAVVGAGPATIPYSGVQAGLIAKADAGGNPNQPAAGQNGASRFALGLSNDYTDDQREALNAAGVCMAKLVYGAVETYGYRTAAGPPEPNWLWFGNSRVLMGISFEANAVAEAYVLRQIDGKRRLFAALEADLRGICLSYFKAGALYGDTPEEAFSVDTGPQINTPASIAAGEVHAVIRVRCSPAAEWVSIEIIKVPVERAVAA